MAVAKCPHCVDMKQQMSDMQSKLDMYEDDEKGEGKQDESKDISGEKMPSIKDMPMSLMTLKKSSKKGY